MADNLYLHTSISHVTGVFLSVDLLPDNKLMWHRLKEITVVLFIFIVLYITKNVLFHGVIFFVKKIFKTKMFEHCT